jgi:uncharacterized protein (TIGR02145 family)
MKICSKQIQAILLLSLFGVLPALHLSAQTVIGADAPDPSAMLDVQSTSKGFLPPRMTTAERNAMSNPATGLLVFNTTLNCVEINLGTPVQPAWACILVGLNTVSAASYTPTLCANTVLTAITHTTTGATGIGTATGLPAGVSAAWASNTITISGTPTAAGTYNYSIPLTGGAGSVSATGTITVNSVNTAGTASSSPTLCVNTALTPITRTTTGATGIGTPTNLPAGVTASWASNTITISGTPTASGTFNYSIPLTGGCGNVNATGTITVNPNVTAGSASSTPTLCTSTALTAITHTTTGATGIGSATNLPAGVTASWASNTITISGTPTAAGTFSYAIPVNGCGSSVNATGSITVTGTLTGCQVCGAGRVLTFSCYNLGAVASTNPYTPRWDLTGNYYQWGRAVVAANGPSGSSSTQTNAGTVSGWNTTAASNGAWADGTKTANDPCPTGFRVPTHAQWQAVLNTSLNPTRSLVGTWTDSNTNYGSGLRVGSGSIGLFLPAAGWRDELDGRLNFRGSDGNYWSSTESGSSARYMYFTDQGPNTASNPRRLGYSVRCIAE